MSIEKEEYIESPISLEGKYPRFLLDGADVLVSFEPDNTHYVVSAADAENDIGGALDLHFSEDSKRLIAIRFQGAAKRWKIERVSVRYEEDRDLVYMRLRWFLRQELSLEIPELEEDLVLDLDKKDRLVGFAINNASKHLAPSVLNNLASGSQWIKLATIDTTYDDIEAVKAAKKAKRQQKRAMSETVRMAATPPSPSFSSAMSRSSTKEREHSSKISQSP